MANSHDTPEGRLMQTIAIWCGERGYMSFRCNAGTFLSADGSRYVVGLPRGFSDMLILKPGGQAAFVETKIHPRKPTDEQVRFISAVRSYGFRAGVAYSLEDAKKIIEGE